MLSGGTYVIGIFLVSETDLITSFPAHLKGLLHQLNKSLSTEYLYGNVDSNEKIVLNYCSKLKTVKCKLFDAINSSVKPAEIKFSDESKFTKLECKYEINKTFCWEEKREIDLKEQMTVSLYENFLKLTYSPHFYAIYCCSSF